MAAVSALKGLKRERSVYLALFFANAIFATLFKSVGEAALAHFGTFAQCDQQKHRAYMGNQMIFRASFSISTFFLVRTALSRFGATSSSRVHFWTLFAAELPLYVGLLIGSFFIPSSFFHGYAQAARVLSGLFILFQITSIVDFSYQARDLLLDRIEHTGQRHAAASAHTSERASSSSCELSSHAWKYIFLATCASALLVTAVGAAFLYEYYGSCGVGVAFTTITVVAAALLVALCVSNWLDVGLLPPCIVSSYLVLMCWQALTSNPEKACESSVALSTPSPVTDASSAEKSMVANAIVAAFAMTWTSWRTSSAASNMFAKPASVSESHEQKQQQKQKKKQQQTEKPSGQRRTALNAPDTNEQTFSGAVVVNIDCNGDCYGESARATTHQVESQPPAVRLDAEPWQFYCMMVLAGLYMAMVLTDWDSADGPSNGVSMWVKIVAQWLTILLFSWTVIAPKLFPDRDFS